MPISFVVSIIANRQQSLLGSIRFSRWLHLHESIYRLRFEERRQQWKHNMPANNHSHTSIHCEKTCLSQVGLDNHRQAHNRHGAHCLIFICEAKPWWWYVCTCICSCLNPAHVDIKCFLFNQCYQEVMSSNLYQS